MHIIFNVLRTILFMLVLPCILGISFEKYFNYGKYKAKLVIPRCLIMGVAIMLALFQIVAVPMIIVGTSFSRLLIVWTCVILICTVFLIARNIQNMKETIYSYFSDMHKLLHEKNKETQIIWSFALLLIVFETCIMLFRTHMDADDSRFIAEAMEAFEKNSLLRIHPITGASLNFPIGEMIKDVVSPYPLFIAAIAKLTGIHPAVLSHAILPVIFIPYAYVVSYLIADFLFKDKRKVGYFMFIIAIVVLFSFESTYSWGYTMLSIIWQGRSIAAVIMLPLLWYVLMFFLRSDEYSKGLYLVIITVALANANLSGMGWMMTPLIGGAFALAYLVLKKKLLPAIMIGLSVMPTVVYMIVYEILW